MTRTEGEPAGNLMSTWRLLRDHTPGGTWEEAFEVWGQPAAWCDGVLSLWLSDHIAAQTGDDPAMIITDCLGSSWAEETVQQYWINNQPAFPLAPGTTSYLAPPDTHVHKLMKDYLRDAKTELQEAADREFQMAGVAAEYQWGPWEPPPSSCFFMF